MSDEELDRRYEEAQSIYENVAQHLAVPSQAATPVELQRQLSTLINAQTLVLMNMYGEIVEARRARGTCRDR
jgi:hypothetical protein